MLLAIAVIAIVSIALNIYQYHQRRKVNKVVESITKEYKKGTT